MKHAIVFGFWVIVIAIIGDIVIRGAKEFGYDWTGIVNFIVGALSVQLFDHLSKGHKKA